MKFVVVNSFDKPYERLVAQVIDDKCYYMERSLDSSMKRYDGISTTQATSLEDFGFEIKEKEFQVDFKLVHESKAKYSDGQTRHWQGAKQFSRPKVILNNHEKS